MGAFMSTKGGPQSPYYKPRRAADSTRSSPPPAYHATSKVQTAGERQAYMLMVILDLAKKQDRDPGEVRTAIGLCPQVVQMVGDAQVRWAEALPVAEAAVQWFDAHKTPYILERTDNDSLRHARFSELDLAPERVSVNAL
jgi:hypothetical protein